jgi:glycosyltransferase involved in cell wall biosynthesis
VGDYVLCNFDFKNRRAGQFIEHARHNDLNLLLLNQRAAFDPTLLWQARRHVRERGINIVQTHGYKSNVLGVFLRAFSRKPWIAFAHGYTDDNWKMRRYMDLDLWMMRYADRVIAVSNATAELLVKSGIQKDRIRLIYNAIETPTVMPSASPAAIKRQHGVAPADKVIGVVGRLNPEKGQMIFLRALKSAIQTCPNLKALLIGDGQDRELLERYCLDNGLAEHVVFAGYRENIADYYQILDLLVLPSLSEGLPNTVLEAMSFGIPVLATRVGGVPEIIGKDNGVMVPPGDPDALAKQIVELLRNDALRASLGAEGQRSLYPRFAPEHRARQIFDVYDELLAGPPGMRASGHDG